MGLVVFMLNISFLMKKKQNTKGQGALEYLLIIGGAVLIAAIVLAIMVKSAGTGKDSTNQSLNDYNSLISSEMDKALNETRAALGEACTVTPDNCQRGNYCLDGICVVDPCVSCDANERCNQYRSGCDCKPGYMRISLNSPCVLLETINFCGNYNIDSGEQCDDGGRNSGDGCSSTCQIETNWNCTYNDEIPASVCCNNSENQVSVSGSCICTDGTSWTPAHNRCIPTGTQCYENSDCVSGATCAVGLCVNTICGDGFITGSEACDDGGLVAGDGCSATCTVETGWVCSNINGAGSICEYDLLPGLIHHFKFNDAIEIDENKIKDSANYSSLYGRIETTYSSDTSADSKGIDFFNNAFYFIRGTSVSQGSSLLLYDAFDTIKDGNGSISFWIAVKDINIRNIPFLNCGSFSISGLYGSSGNAQLLFWPMENISKSLTVNITNPIWHNIVLTKEDNGANADLKVYMDGLLGDDTNSSPKTVYQNMTDCELGRFSDMYTKGWIIDDIRVYNKVLTTPAINALYGVGRDA